MFNRKILDLTPNSKLKSYIFFEKNNYQIEGGQNYYDLSLILWANLRAIDESKQYDQTDDLIADIVHILQNFTCINIFTMPVDSEPLSVSSLGFRVFYVFFWC